MSSLTPTLSKGEGGMVPKKSSNPNPILINSSNSLDQK